VVASQSPALLIPGGDVGYAALDDVWLKEVYTYGRPRKHHVPDMGKLSPEERRTVEITQGEPKGPTPERALAQLIKDKGMGQGRIGMDHFGIPLTIYAKIGSFLPQRSRNRHQVFPLRTTDAWRDSAVRESATLNDSDQ
jgi:hypothetical protein